MSEMFLNNRITLHCGDCLDVLKTLAPDSIDSVCCDPPYHLVSIVKRFGNATPEREAFAVNNPSRRGFMGKQWDGGDIAFRSDTWAEVLRVMKPGAHLVACGGTRTYHRLACAIEDAGFEIRDCIQWLYGSGFPKSPTALKPACEMIVLARKPLSEPTVAANVLKHGTGALNIDGCRVAAASGDEPLGWESPRGGIWKTDSNATAALVKNNLGRWPANVIHDGSDEVVAAFPESDGSSSGGNATPKKIGTSIPLGGVRSTVFHDDSGSAARFFFAPKADSDDRLGSRHPTVKPLDLMQYLVRLITPPRGVCLDLFAGTGTTGEAAFREGMSAILIERELEYQADIRRRMALVMAGPDERARESIKAKLRDKLLDYGPLFAFGERAK